MSAISSISPTNCNLNIDQLQSEKKALTKRLAGLSSMIVSLKLYESASVKNPNLKEIIDDIEKIVDKYKASTVTKSR